ncbi:MAG: type II toxin-antitoxin system VapC family toxin [Gordonia sp. (in: high G+C Gram-positive bacteria)]
MIVLDTNVVSELMRNEPERNVISWTDQQESSTLYLAAFTLAEIRFGLACMPAGRRQETLSTVFETGIRPLFADRILPFDEAATREYARLRASARARGTALSDADAIIAATSSAHRFAVATRDVSPFESAGLRVINPFDPHAES